MKNYVKSILFAYPLLKTVGKDYEEHIKNRALLSYDSNKTAEELAEYLAEEILQMHRLEWLKARVELVLEKLSGVERTMVEIRYFGKSKGVKKLVGTGIGEGLQRASFPERTYFRKQRRLGEKLGSLFVLAGMTENIYERDFADIELFKEIDKGVAAGWDKKIAANERRWLGVAR